MIAVVGWNHSSRQPNIVAERIVCVEWNPVDLAAWLPIPIRPSIDRNQQVEATTVHPDWLARDQTWWPFASNDMLPWIDQYCTDPVEG
jgi:hypothetical protein